MDDAQHALKDVLLPPDRIAAACFAGCVSRHDKPASGDRLLTVIAHSADDAGQSCLFVLNQDVYSNLVIEDVFPLTSELQLSVQQVPAMAPSSEPNLKAEERQTSDFVVSVQFETLTTEFAFEDLGELQLFMTACRRPMVSSEVSGESDLKSHHWILVYMNYNTAQLKEIKQLYNSVYPFVSSPSSPKTGGLIIAAGDRSQEDATYQSLRSSYTLNSVRSHSGDFSETRTLRLRVGTFNVNGQMPSEDLGPWLSADASAMPDVYVLGFQEVDLGADALLYSTSTIREEAWTAACLSAIGKHDSGYVKVASKQLVGMLLLVLARQSISEDITNVETAALGSGILGMMGNKGGVAIRLSVKNTVFCFVNSHLAALDEMVARRNADYAYLSDNLSFGSVDHSSIYDAHALLWLGDLNYRIDIPDEEVRQLIQDEDWAALRTRDQLLANIKSGNCFTDFLESPTDFSPSYQFEIGGSDLHKFKRRPAWTDRILNRGGSEGVIKQLSYKCHPDIVMSDHKPVSADFEVQVGQVDSETLVDTICRTLEDVNQHEEGPMDEEHPPHVALSSKTFDFGEVGYASVLRQTLVVHNDGKIPAALRFVGRSAEQPNGRDWVTVSPASTFILPNQSAVVTLRVEITPTVAAQFNFASNNHLEDIVILHVVHGNDFFIPVHALYQRTCFCSDMSSLIRLPGPIRSFTGDETTLLSESQALSAPRELLHMVSWLMSNASHEADVFLTRGAPMLVDQVRESLDVGHDIPKMFPALSDSATWDEADVSRAVATCLLDFLQLQPQPVVPSSAHIPCANVKNRDEAFEVIASFPLVSANAWISLTAFVHYVVQQSEDKESRVKRLAAVFSDVLFRIELGSNSVLTPVKQRAFFAWFIDAT